MLKGLRISRSGCYLETHRNNSRIDSSHLFRALVDNVESLGKKDRWKLYHLDEDFSVGLRSAKCSAAFCFDVVPRIRTYMLSRAESFRPGRLHQSIPCHTVSQDAVRS